MGVCMHATVPACMPARACTSASAHVLDSSQIRLAWDQQNRLAYQKQPTLAAGVQLLFRAKTLTESYGKYLRLEIEEYAGSYVVVGMPRKRYGIQSVDHSPSIALFFVLCRLLGSCQLRSL